MICTLSLDHLVATRALVSRMALGSLDFLSGVLCCRAGARPGVVLVRGVGGF